MRYGAPPCSAKSARPRRATSGPGSCVSRASCRKSVRHEPITSAAGMPLPDTSASSTKKRAAEVDEVVEVAPTRPAGSRRAAKRQPSRARGGAVSRCRWICGRDPELGVEHELGALQPRQLGAGAAQVQPEEAGDAERRRQHHVADPLELAEIEAQQADELALEPDRQHEGGGRGSDGCEHDACFLHERPSTSRRSPPAPWTCASA